MKIDKKMKQAQEEYDLFVAEDEGKRFNQYCIVAEGSDGSCGIFGEFPTPKEAAEYYKYFLSHAIPEKEVTIRSLTMVSRLDDKDEYYVMDTDFHTEESDD